MLYSISVMRAAKSKPETNQLQARSLSFVALNTSGGCGPVLLESEVVMIRVISKSHENGSNEQIYICTDEDDFEAPASDFLFLDENESIDIDKIVHSLAEFEDLPLPTNRALKAC